MKHYFKVGGILGAIALVCAVLIAFMNLVTSPVIAKNKAKVEAETYSKVYEAYDHNEALEFTKDANGYIQAKVIAYDKDGNVLGYIYTVEGTNSYGKVSLMIGITDGNVVDVEFLENTESFASTVDSHVKGNYPSSKDSVITISPYKKEATTEVSSLNQEAVDSIDVACGATYGATLVKAMVNAALADAKEVK